MVKGTNRVDGNCDSRPSTSVEHVEHGIRHFSRKVLDLVDCIGLERQLITTVLQLFSLPLFISFSLSQSSFYIYCFTPPFAHLSLSLFFFVKFSYSLFPLFFSTNRVKLVLRFQTLEFTFTDLRIQWFLHTA